MEYVKKQCHACGNKFVVTKDAAQKELGCTLGCLTKIHETAEILD